MGANGGWSVNVSVLSDRAGAKGGWTTPWEAPTQWPQWNVVANTVAPWTTVQQRNAFRHGGAVPWTTLREGSLTTGYNGVGIPFNMEVKSIAFPLAAPVAGAHYCLERVNVPFVMRYILTLGTKTNVGPAPAGLPGISYTYAIAAPCARVLALTTVPLVLDFAFVSRPFLGVSPLSQSQSAQGETTLGDATQIALIKQATNGLQAKALGAQVAYRFKMLDGLNGAGLEAAVNVFINPFWEPTLVPFSHTGVYWDISAAQMAKQTKSIRTNGGTGVETYLLAAKLRNGWTYSAEIDEATGKIATIRPHPECNVVSAAVNIDWQTTFAGGYGPEAIAMTWPSGIRKIVARAEPRGIAPVVGFASGALYWRPALPGEMYLYYLKRGFFGPSGEPAPDDWRPGVAAGDLNGVSRVGGLFVQPYTVFTPPSSFWSSVLFKGWGANDAVIGPGSGWTQFATVNFITGSTQQVDAVLTPANYPPPGTEVVITGKSGYTFLSTGNPAPHPMPMRVVILPDAADTAVATPAFGGGVLQGGVP